MEESVKYTPGICDCIAFKGDLAERLGIGRSRVLFVTIDRQGAYKMQGTMNRIVYDLSPDSDLNEDVRLEMFVGALTPISDRVRKPVEEYLEIIK